MSLFFCQSLECVLLLVFWILGNSPHPSTPDEDEGQTELLIAEEKLSPEDDEQVMPRYYVCLWLLECVDSAVGV